MLSQPASSSLPLTATQVLTRSLPNPHKIMTKISFSASLSCTDNGSRHPPTPTHRSPRPPPSAPPPYEGPGHTARDGGRPSAPLRREKPRAPSHPPTHGRPEGPPAEGGPPRPTSPHRGTRRSPAGPIPSAADPTPTATAGSTRRFNRRARRPRPAARAGPAPPRAAPQSAVHCATEERGGGGGGGAGRRPRPRARAPPAAMSLRGAEAPPGFPGGLV